MINGVHNLKSFQHATTSLVSCLGGQSYEDRLKLMSLFFLKGH